MKKLTIENENGEQAEVEEKDYAKLLLKEYEVPVLETENGAYKPDKIIGHIVKKLMEGKEIDDSISGAGDYDEVIERVQADVERSKELQEESKNKKAKAKEERAKAKEEAERKKEQEAAELAKRKEVSALKITEGASVARDEFVKELESLKEQLPESIKLIGEGNRTTIKVDEASEEELSRTFGFLTQKATNNEWLSNQVQFWVGDIVNSLTARGVYKTQKEAGEVVVKLTNAAYSPSAISYYAKMADRTPVELRNVEVQPTAYLLIANAAIPKKGDKESDADFQKRLASFKEGRKELQEKLSNGEVTTRSGIEPHVEKFLIDQGLRKPKDPNVVTTSELYKQLYHSTVALNHLLGVHEEGIAIYNDGETEHRLTEEQLEKIQSESLASLNNIFYSNKKLNATLRDFERGFIIQKKTKLVKKGEDGASKEEIEEQVKIFPEPFWNTKE